MTTREFTTFTQDLFDKQGLRPIDMTTYVERGRRLWAAVYRSGDWPCRLLLGDDLDTYNAKRQDLFDKHGLRIDDFVAWTG